MASRAFHGDEAVKAKYLARVRAHRLADELIKGVGWENGKGCAIGCTLDSYDHQRYPVELGIPVQLAHLEDAIFEHLENGQAHLWPERFLTAIAPGADLALVWPRFAVWLLVDPKYGTRQYADEAGKAVTDQVVTLLEAIIAGEPPSPTVWKRTSAAAWAAGAAARAEAAAWETSVGGKGAARDPWDRMAEKLVELLGAQREPV